MTAFVLGGLAIYAPALHGELIWDDEYLVGQNPFYKSPIFILEAFRHYLFFDSFSTYYRPVQNLSYILDYWLWHGNPFGYHLTNIIIHSLSGFLLYLVLRRLIRHLLVLCGVVNLARTEASALLVAVLWTVHPIHNAAVAYISGRADSLASLFALSAWLLIERVPNERRKWRRTALFVLAGVAMLLALSSKEIALVWLLIFLVYLLFFEQPRSRRAKTVLIAGVVIVFGIYYWLHSLPPYRTPMEGAPPAPLSARGLLMLRALGDYTGLLFFPSKLSMDRSLTSPAMYWNLSSWYASLRFECLSVIGAGALVVGAVLCGKRGPARRLRIFGAIWFIIAFLPISNLFPLNAQVAEHWIYLASIGYLTFLAGCVMMLPPRARQAAGGLAVAAILALGIRTAIRASDWSDPETFYARTIEDGGGTPRIFGNLAAVYAKRGHLSKQEAILRRTLALFPDYTPARINLGICLVNQGRPTESEEFLNFAKPAADEVSRRFPRTWSAALNLAGVRAKAGQTEEALAILAEARTRSPETWELAKYESDLTTHARGALAALPAIERYAAAHWWHEDAWMTLGLLRAAVGDSQAAIEAMRHAGRLDIYNPKPFANIARIELTRNRPEAACEAQKIAVARDPDQPSRYLILADLLERLGRKEAAEAALRRADELRASVGTRAS
ncbi:MAG TPA: tetratricopeptide repeat protein [Chthoniobacteraceae bacterium]|nr:tetratricopeptide repeat protein [Chthoniobacteraceae bacterium]